MAQFLEQEPKKYLLVQFSFQQYKPPLPLRAQVKCHSATRPVTVTYL